MTDGGERHALTVDAETAGTRLDLLIAERLGLSRTQAATLIAEGRVAVGAGREKAGYRVRSGDAIACFGIMPWNCSGSPLSAF